MPIVCFETARRPQGRPTALGAALRGAVLPLAGPGIQVVAVAPGARALRAVLDEGLAMLRAHWEESLQSGRLRTEIFRRSPDEESGSPMSMLRNTRLLLSLGSLSGLVWAGTFATFTDSGTAQSTFTAGTVDLLISGNADDAFAFTSIEMSNMKPGDVKFAPLTIANNGTLGFSYTMSTSATNTDLKALRDQLTLGVKKVATTCDATTYGSSVDVLTASGALSAGAIASRTLAVGASEIACFRIELPSTANDSFQGATTTATFTFSATQS